MRRYLYTLFHPEIFQGYYRKPPYFEGWYFKFVSANHQRRLAVIPGLFLAEDATHTHAFVQILDGVSGDSAYYTFPADAFSADAERFHVCVGDNLFSSDCIRLNLSGGSIEIQGEIHFGKFNPWPVTVTSPGIMGWYAWVPVMECYHGVVSLDHTLDGQLTVNGESIDFGGGRGYIEKDWGRNFPTGYVWQQSNHFETPGTSLTASIAMIPLFGRTFAGFIVGVWHHGLLYRFATYTGAVTEHLTVDDHRVHWVIRDSRYRLEMISERQSGGLLHAPIRTEMHKRVSETMRASIRTRLIRHDDTVILDDTGECAALEVHGELAGLVTAAVTVSAP